MSLPFRLAVYALALTCGGILAVEPVAPKAKTVAGDATPIKAPVVPPKVVAKIGTNVSFKVTGKDVGYAVTFDPSKCMLVRLYSDEPDTLEFLACAYEPGSYGIAFWFIGEKRGVSCNIVADGTLPPPVIPPGPNPYREQLKSAFDSDTGDAAKNNEIRKDLAELYRQGAALPNAMAADGKTYQYQTVAALRDKLRSVAKVLTDDQLNNTRSAIAEIVGGVLSPETVLDAATRVKAATLFATIADALSW